MKRVRVKKYIPAGGGRAAVGIIGGADGPTAIYLKDGNLFKKMLLCAAIFVFCTFTIIAYLARKLSRKS